MPYEEGSEALLRELCLLHSPDLRPCFPRDIFNMIRAITIYENREARDHAEGYRARRDCLFHLKPMVKRPEDRHRVDFQVFLSWSSRTGGVARVSGRCVDLSPSGAKLETIDHLETRSNILVDCKELGRMGMASIRYCVRKGMKYEVGLHFNSAWHLAIPAEKVLDRMLKRRADLP